MTHAEAEKLRADPAHWILGVVYHCPNDPRLIVRNGWRFGWTWNFGHRHVWPGIFIAIFIVIGIPYLGLAMGLFGGAGAAAVFAISLVAIMLVANRLASGPG